MSTESTAPASSAVVLDEATPLLARLGAAAASPELARAGAEAVAGLVREHLQGLDTQRHRFGHHFYRQAAESVTVVENGRGAVVAIGQVGFRQRLLGGPIEPHHGTYLTIPAAPEAYGRRASEFSDLVFAKAFDAGGALRPALVRRTGRQVMYWLVRGVQQAADPTVLPPEANLSAAALAAIQSELERRTSSGTTN